MKSTHVSVMQSTLLAASQSCAIAIENSIEFALIPWPANEYEIVIKIESASLFQGVSQPANNEHLKGARAVFPQSKKEGIQSAVKLALENSIEFRVLPLPDEQYEIFVKPEAAHLFSVGVECSGSKDANTKTLTENHCIAALCIYEHILNKLHKKDAFWSALSDSIGARELRQKVLNISTHVDSAWSQLDNEQLAICYDWEYVPHLIEAGVEKDGDDLFLMGEQYWIGLAVELAESGGFHRPLED